MGIAPDRFLRLEDFVPSLQEALQREPLNLEKIPLAGMPVRDLKERPLVPCLRERNQVMISDGTSVCGWRVESLTSLFRGDQQPPVLGDYPEAYENSFMLLDMHALEMSRLFGDRRDEEMLEIYSRLRRRPDGRSLGFFHDYMWQAAALVLGTHPLSKAEFEAILSRLERSCRTFRMGPTSRNYIATLHQTLGRAGANRGPKSMLGSLDR
jgi:hypothetical protein